MVELPYSKQYQNDLFEQNILKNIFKTFEECFADINNKLECNKQFPNVRFHNVDIRYLYESYEDDLSTLIKQLEHIEKILEYTINNYNDMIIEDFIYNGETIINLFKQTKFGNLQNDILITTMYDIITNSTKFKKYKKLPYIEKIDQFLKQQIQVLIIYDNPINKFLLNPNNLDSYSILLDFIVNFGVILFDYYTIIRYMKIRNYDNKYNNIIYIAGDDHIRMFELYLQFENFNYMLYWNKIIMTKNKLINIFKRISNILLKIGYDINYIKDLYLYTDEHMIRFINRIISYCNDHNISQNIKRELIKYKLIFEKNLKFNNDFTNNIDENPGNRFISFESNGSIAILEKYIK